MKINLNNSDYFDGTNRFKFKKKAKEGIIITSSIDIIGSFIIASNINNNENLESMFQPLTAEVSREEINDMNIIINDNDCSNTFFEAICSELEKDGVSFTVTRDNIDIDRDNSIVITLDQQYSSGSSTLIFAPYNNARVGESDSLALSMQAAFLQNGFFADNISIGKVGYVKDDNGKVNGYRPTDTEESIDSNSDTSFVVISFGTQNINAELVAKSIENGLARQKYYLDNYDSRTDLIYRANNGESAQVVADYFGSTVNQLCTYNKLESKDTLSSQAIINPEVQNMDVFNPRSMFSIDEVKTRAY